MDEKQFWGEMEYRLCRELEGLAERRFRSYWCDGFVPDDNCFSGISYTIKGRSLLSVVQLLNSAPKHVERL